MNKIERWLKGHGYELYEVRPLEKTGKYQHLLAVKERIVLFVDRRKNAGCLKNLEYYVRYDAFGNDKPIGVKATTFEEFKKRMKEVKLWVY